MFREFDLYEEETVPWRDFDGLSPIGSPAVLETEGGYGYCRTWAVRLAYEDGPIDEPIVEFYAIDGSPQFVSSYYISTLLDNYRGNGGSYPYHLALYGDVASWTVAAEDMDDVCRWIEDTCIELGCL